MAGRLNPGQKDVLGERIVSPDKVSAMFWKIINTSACCFIPKRVVSVHRVR